MWIDPAPVILSVLAKDLGTKTAQLSPRDPSRSTAQDDNDMNSSDPQNPKRTLSEISHLFLSSVRERQTGGATRPVRKPPSASRDLDADLTPEEFAQVLGTAEDDS